MDTAVIAVQIKYRISITPRMPPDPVEQNNGQPDHLPDVPRNKDHVRLSVLRSRKRYKAAHTDRGRP